MTFVQFVSVLVCLTSSVITDSGTIDQKTKLRWHRKYDVAKKKAQSMSRPLVVVLENPQDHAQKIDETKLREKNRLKLAKERFELVRVDVNTDYGKRVAAAFGAKRLPYTAITDDRSAQIVFRKAGQMSEEDWTLALARSSRAKLGARLANKPIIAGIAKLREKRRAGLASVQWGPSYESASAEMTRTGRPLFLFLTAPGCTYCEILKKDALTQQRLIDELNTTFVPVMVDGRQRKDLADRFGVKMFPTLAVVQASGEVVELWSGYQTADEFASHLISAKSKLRTSTNLH